MCLSKTALSSTSQAITASLHEASLIYLDCPQAKTGQNAIKRENSLRQISKKSKTKHDMQFRIQFIRNTHSMHQGN